MGKKKSKTELCHRQENLKKTGEKALVFFPKRKLFMIGHVYMSTICVTNPKICS